jgi:hypothetical protein
LSTGDLSPRYQPSQQHEAAPIYTEKTFALAVFATAVLALIIGFFGGYVASKRCPPIKPPTFLSSSSSTSSDAGHHHKDLFAMEIVDKTVSLKK